ncbi:MAG TPA: hypothetical protein VF091_09280 [Gaiellaceae bacterium]
MAVDVQEPTLESFPQRAPAFFASLVVAVIAGLAAWFGLVVFAIWLIAR